MLVILFFSIPATAQEFITWTEVYDNTVYGTFTGGTVTCTSTGIGFAPILFSPVVFTDNLNGATGSQSFWTLGPTVNPPSQSLLFTFSVPVIIKSYNMHDIDQGDSWNDGFVFGGINFTSVVTGGGVVATTSGVASGATDVGENAEYAYWQNSTTPVSSFSINYLVNSGLTHAYLGYSIQLAVKPTLEVIGETNVCLGDRVLLTETSIFDQSWALESDPGHVLSTDTYIYVAPLVTTTYICFNGEETIRHTVVVDRPIIGTDLGPDITLCQGQFVTLSSINSPSKTKIEWQDGSKNQIQTVNKSGVYWIKESNFCGYERDTINVEIIWCGHNLVIPNLITPNADGLNDLFIPIESVGIKDMKTEIYNRWGVKVFETSDRLIQWDGEDVSDGVYYWSIKYTDMQNADYDLKGFVQVMK